MEKKIRGTYKIDNNKTPQENITEILKLMMPVKLTLNKLQEGTNKPINSRDIDVLELSGIKIEAVGQHKYAICKDIQDFRRIQFRIRIPGRNWGRQSSRNWSVPVKWIPKKNHFNHFKKDPNPMNLHIVDDRFRETNYSFEDYDKKVSLTHIANVFDELSKLYEDGEVKEVKDKKLQEQAKTKLEKLKKESGMPTEVSLRHRHTNYGNSSVENWDNSANEIDDEKEPEYEYSVSINLGQLNEEQVIKMGSLFNEISRIKKGEDIPQNFGNYK